MARTFSRTDFGKINQKALDLGPELLGELLPGGKVSGREFICGNFSGEQGRSLSINLDSGLWADFATNQRGGDLISLWAAVHRVSQSRAAQMLANRLDLERFQETEKMATPPASEKWLSNLPPHAPSRPLHNLGEPTAVWTYRTPEGRNSFFVLRWDTPSGKEIRPLTLWKTKTGLLSWAWKHPPQPKPLYHLDQLTARPDAPILITEGEKTSDAAENIFPHYVALTSPGGAKAAEKADWSPLKRRDVTIWPDHDQAGRDYAADVARQAHKIGAYSVSIVDVPADWPEGWDLADPLPDGETRADLIEMVETSSRSEPPQALTKKETPTEGLETSEKRESQKKRLVLLADGLDFWHGPDNEAYVTLEIKGHFENYPVRYKIFRHWLGRAFYLRENDAPSAGAMEDALGVLEARSRFDGPEYPIFTRVGFKAGQLFLDLGDPDWRSVEIGPDGWRILENPQVKFRRGQHMRPLPNPNSTKAGLERLKEFLPAGPGFFELTVGWLLAALHPKGPYPVLILEGVQGSGKSTLARMLKRLIDPAVADLRTAPRDERDLCIAAANSWILTLDNLSGCPPNLSDALCRLSTGGGLATRRLYTDQDETVFDVTRPIILTGIAGVASRFDLLDRSIILTLPSLPEETRRSEAELWKKFEAYRPEILGGLLDGVGAALRHQNQVSLKSMPRMADSVVWITAAEIGGALPWAEGHFLEFYQLNRHEAVETSLQADLVAASIMNLMEGRDLWEGNATELLTELEALADHRHVKSKTWPANASALGQRLAKAQTFLEIAGFELTKRRDGESRKWIIQKTAKEASHPSHPSQHQENQLFMRDGNEDGKVEGHSFPSPYNYMKLLDDDRCDRNDGKIPVISNGADLWTGPDRMEI